ncbi:MAG: glycosyltransferase family 2 protein [Magnetococcales bacterium]|nr:glycosyltransferase family 2 protein [Magnetococcales bacterium]
MTRPPLSAVIICQNAATVLPPCLESLDFVDEILLVDSGSRDPTLEIAQRFGCRVEQHPWLGFGPQKHLAVSLARHDWVLCLDSDERVSPELRRAILDALDNPRFQAYRFPRRNRFLGRWLYHGEGYPDYNLRLFHRQKAQWTSHPVHEFVQPEAGVAVGVLKGDLLHESEQGIATYLDKQNRYTSLQAGILFEKGFRCRWHHLLLSPLVRFIKFALLRQGLRDGIPGLIHIGLGCLNTFVKYAKVLEREWNAKREGDS